MTRLTTRDKEVGRALSAHWEAITGTKIACLLSLHAAFLVGLVPDYFSSPEGADPVFFESHTEIDSPAMSKTKISINTASFPPPASHGSMFWGGLEAFLIRGHPLQEKGSSVILQSKLRLESYYRYKYISKSREEL